MDLGNWKIALILSIKEFIKAVLLAVLPMMIAMVATQQLDWVLIGWSAFGAFLIALNEMVKKWDQVDSRPLQKATNGVLG